MKRLALLFAFALICFTASFAQSKNVIKMNAFGLIGGNYMLAYERSIADKFSVQLAASYVHLGYDMTVNSSQGDGEINGFMLIPEVRYYPLAEGSPKGFYTGAFMRMRSVTEDFTDFTTEFNPNVSYTDKTLTMGGGLVIGYQALIGDRIALDIFAGPQYKAKSTERTYEVMGITDSDFASKFPDFKIREGNGFGLRFGFNIGVAF